MDIRCFFICTLHHQVIVSEPLIRVIFLVFVMFSVLDMVCFKMYGLGYLGEIVYVDWFCCPLFVCGCGFYQYVFHATRRAFFTGLIIFNS